jgi:hypothetical protein
MKSARARTLLVAAAAVLAAPRSTRAERVSPMDVTASCEHRAAKGRVLCDVELEVPSGRIAWADVVVLSVPPFAAPLRSRASVADARTRTDRRVRIPVAFVATALGKGPISVRGRAVVCTAGERGESCSPRTGEATAELLVATDVL